MLHLTHNLHIWLISFVNIDVTEQGYYYISIAIQKADKISRVERSSLSTNEEAQKHDEKPNNAFKSPIFLLKYNNQQIKIDQMYDFTIQMPQKKQKVNLVLTLLKRPHIKDGNFKQNFQKAAQCSLEVDISLGLCQFKESRFLYPQCSILNLMVISMPICLKIKHSKSKEPNLSQLKSLMKKYRYNSYVVGKILWSALKDKQKQYKIMLPKMFLTKQDTMQHAEATSESLLKFLALYQSYQLNLSQLEEEMAFLGQQNAKIMQVVHESISKMLFDGEIFRKIFLQQKIKRYERRIFIEQIGQGKKGSIERTTKIRKIINQMSQVNVSKLISTNQDPFLPILLVQTQIKAPKIKKKYSNAEKVKNVIILAHGFQGSYKDMLLLKNILKEYLGKGQYIILTAFTNQMNQSIQNMAQKAAEEIISTLKQKQLTNRQLRIYMVGHSMGGLILRASLKHLKQYSSFFHSYISLGTPHLGYIQGTKISTKVVLNLISSFSQITSLKQISNKDRQNPYQSFIYEVSLSGNLGQFKNLILVSSTEDNYVPWHSARIQEKSVEKKNQKDEFQMKLIENILMGQRLQRIQRIQIDYDVKQKNIDYFIGRTAHVSFLSSQNAINMLLIACKHINQN